MQQILICEALLANLLTSIPDQNQMKPRVQMSPEEFILLATQLGKSVVETGKIMLMGHMYVTTGDDYVYFTYSAQTLSLPKDIEIIRAVSVEF